MEYRDEIEMTLTKDGIEYELTAHVEYDGNRVLLNEVCVFLKKIEIPQSHFSNSLWDEFEEKACEEALEQRITQADAIYEAQKYDWE